VPGQRARELKARRRPGLLAVLARQNERVHSLTPPHGSHQHHTGGGFACAMGLNCSLPGASVGSRLLYY